MLSNVRFKGRKLKHSVYRETTLFMSRFFSPTIFGSLPDHSHNLLVIQFFINPITSENDKIIIIPDFETLNIRCRDYYWGLPPYF
jgi:pilus assembly protein TadC